jgi:CubicO group peptidase (beta-lactamase class C family)
LAYIKEPYFPPGEGWRYSNTNYLLLAMIIENATNSKLSTEFKQRFKRRMGSGETAIGHSGANIGTSAYMVHLPEHHLSVVVMLNSFDHKCSEAIVRGSIATVLKDLRVLGMIPFIAPFFIWGGLISATIFLIVNIGIRRRKRTAEKVN